MDDPPKPILGILIDPGTSSSKVDGLSAIIFQRASPVTWQWSRWTLKWCNCHRTGDTELTPCDLSALACTPASAGPISSRTQSRDPSVTEASISGYYFTAANFLTCKPVEKTSNQVTFEDIMSRFLKIIGNQNPTCWRDNKRSTKREDI